MLPAWHQKAARQEVFYAQIAQQHHNEDLSEGNLLNGANQQHHDAAPTV